MSQRRPSVGVCDARVYVHRDRDTVLHEYLLQ